MFIEPAEYLSLTDHIALLTQRLAAAEEQKQAVCQEVIILKESNRLLAERVKQLEAEAQKAKDNLKQHVSAQAAAVKSHITEAKQGERAFIEQQISKLRNTSALEKLKELEQKMLNNQFSTPQKELCQKLKALFIINTKRSTCTYHELLDWVTEVVNQNRVTFEEAFSGMNASEVSMKKSSGTKKSIAKLGAKSTKNTKTVY